MVVRGVLRQQTMYKNAGRAQQMRVPLGTQNRYFPPLSVFSAVRRDYEKNERGERLHGVNLLRWQQTRRRDGRMLPRLVLSPKPDLQRADIYAALRVASMDSIKRTRWWQTLSTQTDTRDAPEDAPVQGTLHAVGCSLQHEDLLRDNDANALLEARGLEVLGDGAPLWLHELHTSGFVLTATRVASCDVVWSAARRDGMTAWVVLHRLPMGV